MTMKFLNKSTGEIIELLETLIVKKYKWFKIKDGEGNIKYLSNWQFKKYQIFNQ